MEKDGFNLTEEIRRELAAKGNADAAASDTFGFWLAVVIPDANEAEAEARRRGMIFGPDARRLAEAYFVEARRRFDDLAREDAEPLDADAFDEARRDADEAAARADRCGGRICDALRWLAKGKGEAAKLARGAIADFLNCLAADDVAEAARDAFKAANAAARAYFVEKGDWQKSGKAKRAHLSKKLLDVGAALLEELGAERDADGFKGPFERGLEARFTNMLARRGLYGADNSPDMPHALFRKLTEARSRARRRRKPL